MMFFAPQLGKHIVAASAGWHPFPAYNFKTTNGI